MVKHTMYEQRFWGVSRCLIILALVFCEPALSQGDEDECFSGAFTDTDPKNELGEAISNAFAGAFTKAVNCGDDDTKTQHPSSVSGLAVSIAVAISSTETAGQECIAEADAFADKVGEMVADEIGAGLLRTADEDKQKLAEAWLASEGDKISEVVRNKTRATKKREPESKPVSTPGCIDISALTDSLPTALNLGETLEDAIKTILQAVTCRDNIVTEVEKDGVVEKAPRGCVFDSETKTFIGTDCVPPKEPASDRQKCIDKYMKCITVKSRYSCQKQRFDCFIRMAKKAIGKKISDWGIPDST